MSRNPFPSFGLCTSEFCYVREKSPLSYSCFWLKSLAVEYSFCFQNSYYVRLHIPFVANCSTVHQYPEDWVFCPLELKYSLVICCGQWDVSRNDVCPFLEEATSTSVCLTSFPFLFVSDKQKCFDRGFSISSGCNITPSRPMMSMQCEWETNLCCCKPLRDWGCLLLSILSRNGLSWYRELVADKLFRKPSWVYSRLWLCQRFPEHDCKENLIPPVSLLHPYT